MVDDSQHVYGRLSVALRSLMCGFLVASVLLANGCGSRSSNPVGTELVARRSGGVVSLKPLDMAEGGSAFEGAARLVFGGSPGLLAGQMNGIAFGSLLRFRVPADSLARAAGGQDASGLTVQSLRVILGTIPNLVRGDGELSVEEPRGEWSESTAFVDSLAFVEIPFASVPLPDVRAVHTEVDSTVRVDLPVSAAESAIQADPQDAEIELMLGPMDGEEFVAVMVSREVSAEEGAVDRRPRLELQYSVDAQDYLYESNAIADTYWSRREGGGPASDVLLLSSGIRYSSILRFDFPDSIPSRSTVNSVVFEVDVDRDRSLYDFFLFQVDKVEFDPDIGDTTFTNFDNDLFESDTTTLSIEVNRALVQGWVTGEFPNHGMALRASDNTRVTWVTLERPRLTIVYSLPPELD
jgi:hypothetical protein